MKNTMKGSFVAGLCAAVLLGGASAKAETESGIEGSGGESVAAQDKVDILFGVGFIISSGYGDYTDDAYPGYETTGGFGWLDLYFGVEYKATPQISVIGGVDLWLNGADVMGGVLDETYFNTIIIPSVYVQYYFTESRSFYVNGGIGIPIPSTGSEYYEFSSNGITLGGNIGYAFGEGLFRLEAGYSFVPVKVEATDSHPLFTGSEEYDFGGLQLRMMLGF